MYKLEQPAMAVNDPRVSVGKAQDLFTRRFQMWDTWDIRAGEPRQDILNRVAAVARKAPGGRLRHLVLNCRTLPAYLQLGEGFDRSHLPLFEAWRGLIDKIWIPDCEVAQIPDAVLQERLDRDHPGLNTGNGNLFCSGLAKTVYSYVVAPTELQNDTTSTYPAGEMPGFKGLVLSYGPDGYVTCSRKSPFAWLDKYGEQTRRLYAATGQ